MKNSFATKIFFAITLIFIIQGCSSLQLSPVDFSWPLEEVLNIEPTGTIQSSRYSFSINVTQLFIEEKTVADFSAVDKVRLLRNIEGYYFITAQSFKNVYVFYVNEGKMILSNKILVNEKGLTAPAMNQRSPYIELIDGTSAPLQLTSKGLKGDSK